MAHNVRPILPLDITLTTFLVPDIPPPPKLDAADLVATKRATSKFVSVLAAIHTNALGSYFKSVQQFMRGPLDTSTSSWAQSYIVVLVRNSTVETDLVRKPGPCYVLPLVIIPSTPNGLYRLAELDGTGSKLRFVAFYLLSRPPATPAPAPPPGHAPRRVTKNLSG